MEYCSGTRVPDSSRASVFIRRRYTTRLFRWPSLARWFAFVLALVAAHGAKAFSTYIEAPTTVVSNLSGYSEMLTPTSSGWIWNFGTYSATYPSNKQNMQFIAFRKPTGEILYVQTEDPEGRYMKWEVVSAGGGIYQLKLTTQSLDGMFPVSVITDSSMTAATQAEFYRKVAHKYKAWAVQQSWASRKFSPMDKTSAMINVQNLSPDTRTEVSNYLVDWSGQNTLCYVTYWRKYWQLGIDGGVPDYRIDANDALGPPFTTEDSKGNVQKLDQLLNCKPFGYTNPVLWDTRIKTYSSPANVEETSLDEIATSQSETKYDDKWMVKDDVLGTHVATYNAKSNFVCPAVADYQQLFTTKMEMMAGYNFKGFYADQIAFEAPKLCYDNDPDHGHNHDLGSPFVYKDGLRKILEDVKTATGMMVFTEGSAEIYMDLVDAYLMWDKTANADSTGAKQVPLFREVYGEFTRWIGWQINVPEYYEPTCAAAATSTPELELCKTTFPQPDALLSAIRKADNFGYSFHGQPFMLGTSTNENPRKKMTPGTTDPYKDVREAIAAPPYKTVYERGSGLVNWVSDQEGLPDLEQVVDSETSTAAIQVDLVRDDESEDVGTRQYSLPIDETQKFQLSWDMKMSSDYAIVVEVSPVEQPTWTYMLRYQNNLARNVTDFSLLGVAYFGLGSDTTGNQWRTIQRNLAADLLQASTAWGSPLMLGKVHKISVVGIGLIDNIALSGSPAQVVEDGASASDWTAGCSLSGCTTTGLNASSVVDADTGANVISFTGIVDRDDNKWFRRMINDNGNFEASWDLKAGTDYYVMFTVEAEDGTQYNLLYDKRTRDDRETVGITVKIGLGADTTDGKWRTFRRNLADDLYEGTGKGIKSVVSMRVFSTCSISNVKLWGNGKMRSSGY